jgi:hypothetical protein
MCVNCVIYVLIVYETDWKVEIWAAWSPRKHLFSMAREQAGENRLVLFSAACSPAAENRPELLLDDINFLVVLTPECAITHEHDLVHNLLVIRAPTDQTGMCCRSDQCVASTT